MADQTYDQLLSSIGFPAADAASAEERTKRKLGLATADVNLNQEQEAKKIDTGWEDRGMFNSGGRHEAQAYSQAEAVNKVGQLAISAADDIARNKEEIARAQAQQAAQDASLDMQRQQFDQQMGFSREQMAQQKALADMQMEYERKKQQQLYAQAMLGGSGGGGYGGYGG